MKNKKILTLVLLPLFLLILGGCNIFEWASGDSAGSLIDAGNRHMRDAEYAAAREKFARAMEEDPDDSEARYYHAKATLREAGFNALTLANDISDDFDENSTLPFTGGDWTKEKAGKLYQAVRVIYTDLKPIYDEETTGIFNKDDIDLDFAVILGIRGILMFQDTNIDSVINSDDFDLRILFDKNKGGFQIDNLFDFLNPGAAKATGTADEADSLIAQFNNMLDNVEVIIEESRDIIVDLLTEDFGVDPADIDRVLQEIIDIAAMYKINDCLDNDNGAGHNFWPIGPIDEETINGFDDDGDGWIDEDSHYDTELYTYPTTCQGGN